MRTLIKNIKTLVGAGSEANLGFKVPKWHN